MIKDRTGEVYAFSDGRTMEIVKYFNTDNISVMFNDGSVISNERYSRFKIGQIKNKNTPVVCGVGYFGCGIYSQKNNTVIYSIWIAMIGRCYSDRQLLSNPTYKDCLVDSEWHNFQNFAKWYDENHIEGFELDKDILIKGNRIYSSKTCCFVPKEINTLLTNAKRIRGKYAIGVSVYKRTGIFFSQISIGSETVYLGSFKSEIEAFNAYKKAKEENIKIQANKFKEQITPECYNALMNWTIDIND